ncbi:sulfurtransferase [Labrys wisconsinensis]|uniref:Thiosulfate/3-mercaptopyruvate sulfurtransferase n=1 Tax=Labrys wisconsinensis TaxID=425677 RepID=A0ABU0J4G4_9HYPH|nr:rhodanese-like domain-containing protein [Labrys wisconsinensis]MDQ0469161.1 thiosulfate/3-mercaptopyruvate sulfurtransferase [Labrys wisconsinensis]
MRTSGTTAGADRTTPTSRTGWDGRPLVSADWLSRHLADADLTALDASVAKATGADGARAWRSGLAAFETTGHIPGARFADLIDDFSSPAARFAFTRPTASRFAAAASALGLTDDRRLVIYDDSTGIWAARLWWLFRAFGHDAVAVLDGGLGAWTAGGGRLETGRPAETPTAFTARERPGFFVETADVLAIVEGRAPGTLACVLRRPVFTGAECSYSRPGHIPGSLSLPHGELLSPDGRFRPPAELRRRLAPLLAGERPIVAYCGGGVTAAGTALALALAGADGVTIYDGSLAEWSANPALPMATGS